MRHISLYTTSVQMNSEPQQLLIYENQVPPPPTSLSLLLQRENEFIIC